MRSFATLALAGLVASAVAAPMNDGHKYDEKKVDEKHYDDKKYDDKHYDEKKHSLNAFPFHFTSTFHAKAVPDTMCATAALHGPTHLPSQADPSPNHAALLPTARASQDRRALLDTTTLVSTGESGCGVSISLHSRPLTDSLPICSYEEVICYNIT